MSYMIAALIALWLGIVIGRQKRWSRWHGPVGAVITVPIAMWLGFDAALAVLAPLALAIGFAVVRLSSS
ncbi:MAG: hypothetical protein H6876_10075 [Hyphomicrobiaceae bacterium]|nr:hypothetical protein [Hyphomicrobiaceae bacterium]